MPEVEHTLEANGKVYTAHRVGGTREKAWAKWLFRLYREIAQESRDEMSDEEYKVKLDELDDEYFRGEFSMLSPRGVAALPTHRGSIMLTQLVFDIDENEALALLAAKPVEVPALIHTILRESFPMQVEAPEEAGEAAGEAAGGEPAKKKLPPVGFRPTHRRSKTPPEPSSSITSN